MINLKNKVAFITGSSSGIGFSIAKKLSNLGCKCILNGSNKNKLIKAKKKILNSEYIVGDVTNFNFGKKLKKQIQKKSSKLDILVCNVGGGKVRKKEKLNEFLRIFNLNFFSTVNIISNLKSLLQKTNGNIVCVSSICGLEYIEGAPASYSSSKAALNAYAKFISFELAKYRVRVNIISPGNILFKNSTWDNKIKKNKKKTFKIIRKNVALNKFGDREDISNFVAYICSDSAKFVTGSNFVIDGGQTKNFR